MSQFPVDTFEVCMFDAATGSFSEPDRWIVREPFFWTIGQPNTVLAELVGEEWARAQATAADWPQHSTCQYKLRIQPWGQNDVDRAERIIVEVQQVFSAEALPFSEADWGKR